MVNFTLPLHTVIISEVPHAFSELTLFVGYLINWSTKMNVFPDDTSGYLAYPCPLSLCSCGWRGYLQHSARMLHRGSSRLLPMTVRCPMPSGPVTSSQPSAMQPICALKSPVCPIAAVTDFQKLSVASARKFFSVAIFLSACTILLACSLQ